MQKLIMVINLPLHKSSSHHITFLFVTATCSVSINITYFQHVSNLFHFDTGCSVSELFSTSITVYRTWLCVISWISKQICADVVHYRSMCAIGRLRCAIGRSFTCASIGWLCNNRLIAQHLINHACSTFLPSWTNSFTPPKPVLPLGSA